MYVVAAKIESKTEFRFIDPLEYVADRQNEMLLAAASQILPTVVFIWESTNPHLCSRFSLFKTSWPMLEVPPQQSPQVSYLLYLRTFKWGTVWHSTSRGIRTARILIQKFQKSLLLLSEVESLNLQVVAVLMLFEIKPHTVPHLKVINNGNDFSC